MQGFDRLNNNIILHAQKGLVHQKVTIVRVKSIENKLYDWYITWLFVRYCSSYDNLGKGFIVDTGEGRRIND